MHKVWPNTVLCVDASLQNAHKLWRLRGHLQSPGIQLTLRMTWCLIWWFASIEKHARTWLWISLLRPGVIKQRKTQTPIICLHKKYNTIQYNTKFRFAYNGHKDLITGIWLTYDKMLLLMYISLKCQWNKSATLQTFHAIILIYRIDII